MAASCDGCVASWVLLLGFPRESAGRGRNLQGADRVPCVCIIHAHALT